MLAKAALKDLALLNMNHVEELALQDALFQRA